MHTLNETMVVNEIFYSIQGESSYFGLPCVFVRLTGCPLRCAYCDTEHAFYEGKTMTIAGILESIKQYDCRLVEVTGGEPLAQKECVALLHALLKDGYHVLLETSGALPVNDVPSGVVKIMDIKCPSSGEDGKNNFDNISFLSSRDEIKFVIGTQEDYDYAKEILNRYSMGNKHTVLFSPVYGRMELKTLAEWILRDALPVRLQTQFHKWIWGGNARGV